MKITKRITALFIILALSVPANSVWASEKVEIFPARVEKPQNLKQKGNVKDIDDIVDSIEKVKIKTNLSGKAYECNQEIFVAANGDARVVKCHFDNPETVPLCQELDSLMKQYGYREYSLDVYYDNPEAGEEPINNGPICVTGHIGYTPYTYYFYDNTLIRRITSETKSDNVKTNDFLNKMYKIMWEFQNIERPEDYSVTDIPRTNENKPLVTDSELSSCISRNYNYLKKKYGPHNDYAEIKADLKENPFWYYCLQYDTDTFMIYSDNDKIGCIYSSADRFWDLPRNGMNVYEFVERTKAEIIEVYIEECLGDLFLGEEGDIIISLAIDGYLYSIVVEDGRIWPDSAVQVWEIVNE